MSQIKEIVENLSYPYQPIFNHPELDKNISRECIDRENIIFDIIKNYKEQTNKQTIKVLDLGCSQGYFCLKSASLGYDAHGVDILQENIDCCQELAKENNFNIKFEVDALSPSFVEKIKNEKYDVVLALSVLHHVSNEFGFKQAQHILNELSLISDLVICEMALKEEPVIHDWKKHLPEKYDKWYDDISFYKKVGLIKTHLSNIKRPLILSSNKYFLFDNNFYKIDEYKNKSFDSQAKANDAGRRFYFSNDLLLKFYKKDDEDTLNEIKNEIIILSENRNISFFPKLIKVEENEHDIYIMQKINKGTLLWDLLRDKQNKIDKNAIILNILDNLVELEEQGLFHNDIRSWNICVDKNKSAFLIDPGSISTSMEDAINKYNPYGDYKFNVYNAFTTFVYDLLLCNLYMHSNCVQITCLYNFNKIPKAYSHFMKKSLVDENITFSKIKNLFKDYVIGSKVFSLNKGEKLLLKNIQKRQKKAIKDGADFKKYLEGHDQSLVEYYLFNNINTVKTFSYQNTLKISIWGLNLFSVKEEEIKNSKTFYLINFIPFYKIKALDGNIKHYLFGIPFYKIKTRGNDIKYYLLGLPCLKIKKY